MNLTSLKNWKTVKLGDVANVIPGYAFKGEHFGVVGVPIVKITEIQPPYVSFEKSQRVDISNYDLAKIKKYELRKGDYVVAMTGATIGKVGKIVDDVEALLNQRVAKIEAKEGFDNTYVYYQVFSDRFFKYIQQVSAGSSAQQNVSGGDIEKFEVVIPESVEEQKEIAAILGSLDDKIELLRRQNKTLESIAQALFREWFVEFKFPGYEKVKVVDGVLEGWKIGKLGDIVDHIKDSVSPSKSPDKIFKVYSIPAYDSSEKPEYQKGSFVLSNKYAVKQGSFLISKLNPFTPRIWTIFDVNENSVCSTEFQVVKPKEDLDFAFLHCFLNSEYFTKEFASKISGTSSSHQRAKPQDILNMELTFSEKIVKSFHDTAYPIVFKINNNKIEIQTLSRLRDDLLNRIFS